MFSIVYITAGSMEEARNIGRTLVIERLAACVNIFPITSIFRWNDEIDESGELVIIAKTRSSKVKEIEKRVRELHSYEVPCIVSFKIDEGQEDFFNWIDGAVKE